MLYPPKCLPLQLNLQDKELERRLSDLSTILQNWKSSNYSYYTNYAPLARHLLNFLSHKNKCIKIHVVRCLSDIFRAFSPTPPHADCAALCEVLKAFTEQLEALKNPQSVFYKDRLYILASLISGNVFSLCTKLPRTHSQEALMSLLATLAFLPTQNPEELLSRLIRELLSRLFKSSEMLEQLLPLIFLYISTPETTESTTPISFFTSILSSCKNLLEPFLAKRFLKVLATLPESDLRSRTSSITTTINGIFPTILQDLLPQLNALLISKDHETRSKLVLILSELLKAEQLDLMGSNEKYLELYLKRFIDIHEMVRVTCFQQASYFLLNLHTRKHIIYLLKMWLHDDSPLVRMEVVSAIMSAADEDINILAEEKDLMSIIRGRILDVNSEIRQKTLERLGNLYRSVQTKGPDASATDDTKVVMRSIANEILCGYYIKSEEDRFWLEKIVLTWMVRFRQGVEEQVKSLYLLFASCNPPASRAFVDLHVHRFTIRRYLTKLFEAKAKDKYAEQRSHDLEKEIQDQLQMLSTFFRDPSEAKINLQRFLEALDEDPSLFDIMEKFLQPKTTCDASMDAINEVLSIIADPDETNPYYRDIKILLERSCTIIVDEPGVRVLIQHIKHIGSSESSHVLTTTGLDKEAAVVKGFKLLEVFSFVSASNFTHPDTLQDLAKVLRIEHAHPSISISAIKIFTNIGKVHQLHRIPSIWNVIQEDCQRFVVWGSQKQAKAAIKLISNLPEDESHEILEPLLMEVGEALRNPTSSNLKTSIASLGYIAFHCGSCNRRADEHAHYVFDNILRPRPESQVNLGSKTWCERDQLPEVTLRSLEAMKCLMRWTISGAHETWITEIIRTLVAFISRDGDVDRRRQLGEQEKSWLRLQAGCCLLKLARYTKLGDHMTPEQVYRLSKLMLDRVLEVRRKFQDKLTRGMDRKCPKECLPLDFMGFYALGGFEWEEELKERLRKGMIRHCRKRASRWGNAMECGGIPEAGIRYLRNIMPECGVMYAVPILAHVEGFTEGEEVEGVRMGLELVMGHFMQDGAHREQKFRFFKQLFERLRACRDSQAPGDQVINAKIQRICDIALLVLEKDVRGERSGFGADGPEFEPVIGSRFLTFDQELFDQPENTQSIQSLEQILDNLEEEKKKKKKKEKKLNMGTFLNRVFGLNKTNRKRKPRDHVQPKTSKKRRKE